MSLINYKAKRLLEESKEPAGKVKKTSGALRFVVQRHDARHLHFDFRLEFKGVLLSWAVPKEPSMDPSVKRLAIHVEDHPLDYQYFEGTIPKGNYGAGTVEIWDKGTYTVPDCKSKHEEEKKISTGMAKGHIDFTLDGEQLQGTFALIRLQNAEAKDQWLLIKKDEEKKAPKKKVSDNVVSKGKKSPFPHSISPMLATLATAPFDNEDWLFEIKWDGYRAVAYLQKNTIQLLSRNDLDFNSRFKSIVEALKEIPAECILDGELVVLDDKGKSRFQLMQNYQKTGKGNIVYYIFDIMFKDGMDLRDMPLVDRKSLLKKLLDPIKSPLLRYSDHILTQGTAFFKAALKNGLEGIMAKRIQSLYHSRRSKEWLKIKSSHRQELVIGGFTAPRGGRQLLGALLVGFYENDKLRYAGHVGGGFTASLLKDIYEQLKPLEQSECPFIVRPKPNEKVTWVKPRLICEVSFAE
ncbi:MAG: non-homologous end-joining DNA ligase [Parachlamydiales bacterium]|jgi:bifunctional non-homologous end joining protein LigD